MKLSKCLLPLALLLLPTEARLSQIHFKEISLEDLQDQAPIILRARYQKTAAEKKPNRGMQFELEEVFRETDEQFRPKQRIEVWQKSAQAWGMVKQRAEATGMHVSPIVPSYRMADQRVPKDKQLYLLFLEPGVKDGEYVFSAQDGFEEPEKVPTHFSARVLTVVPVQQFAGKATPVDIDPRFVMQVDQVKVSRQGNAVPGNAYAIHSPVKTFPVHPEKLTEQVLYLTLWRTEGKPPTYRLEEQKVTSP